MTAFDPLTGEMVAVPRENSLDLMIINEGKDHRYRTDGVYPTGTCVWYPLYDWSGKYIGAVLAGRFEDAENIRKRHGEVS